MKRVTIFKNGTDTNGRVLSLSNQSLESFLQNASDKLGMCAKRIFTTNGGELDDVSLIKDDEVLFISSGENICRVPITAKNWLKLNVGGRIFLVSRDTIEKEPDSMLARMFATDVNCSYHFTPSNVDEQGGYLIDRSPTYFEPILNYLRSGKLIYDNNINVEGILEEAKYYGIQSLIPQLQDLVDNSSRSRDHMPLTRFDVVKVLITKTLTELRFQGVNLAGADLSKLDLRFINFKYACLSRCKLSGANLSYCNLERADLSHACVEQAQLLGVKCLCANMEGANFRDCNFEDPKGSVVNMEGVNLNNAVMEGSNMAGVNLRVANLKFANLKSCDLRGAQLAGANLEGCNLSCSDLQEANLRGANLKNATFELMLTPLHMSQTIR